MTALSSAPVRTRRGAGGPRTAAGKARSSKNARRHGLAAATDPAMATARDRSEPRVLAMAQALVAGAGAGAGAARSAMDASQATTSWTATSQGGLWDRALDVAVAEFDLQRVRLARDAVLARAEGDRATLREVASLVATDAIASIDVAALLVNAGLADEGLVMVTARELAAFERYHLRALARLHRARNAFEAAWSAREAMG